jgi:hypothetical protein
MLDQLHHLLPPNLVILLLRPGAICILAMTDLPLLLLQLIKPFQYQ